MVNSLIHRQFISFLVRVNGSVDRVLKIPGNVFGGGKGEIELCVSPGMDSLTFCKTQVRQRINSYLV